MDFFKSVKIMSMTSFGREVKTWVRKVDLRLAKESQAEIRASEQNLSDFSRSIIESDANGLRCKERRKTRTTTVAGTD